MLKNPKYFAKYYYGTPGEIAYKRKYSFSDRCRYYYANPEVEDAVAKLFDNFKDGVPLGLLGASGAGKSVTLQCIAGTMRPDAGRIVLNGRVLFDSERRICLPPQKRNIGFLFQQYAIEFFQDCLLILQMYFSILPS